MSQFERKPMRGTIFFNQSENPKAPKLTGTLKLENGSDIRIALWIVTDRETGEARYDKHGKKFFSAKLSWPEKQEHSSPADTQQSESPEDDFGF